MTREEEPMTSHIQPEASLDERLRSLLEKEGVDFNSEDGQHIFSEQRAFISQAIAEAIQEERRRIVSRIEEEKSKGYEANTILEGLIAELKIGSLINQKNV